MKNESLNDILGQSRPITSADNPRIDHHMRELTSAARAAALEETGPSRWSRARKTALFAGVAAVALGLTAGAVLTFLPGTYDVATEVAFPYPLNPFDDTSVQGPTECVATVQFDQLPNEGSSQTIEDFVAGRDWSAIGAATFDRAQRNPDPDGFVANFGPNDVAAFTSALDDELRLVFDGNLPAEGRYIGVGVTCEARNS